MEKINPKDNACQLFCMYLAEEMRMRVISLGEAKQIASAVVSHKNLIDNEEHLLAFVVELTKDYPQLKRFQTKLSAYIAKKNRTDADKQVTAYAASIMDSDQVQAMQILQDAIDSSEDLGSLKQKYPKFAEYLKK